MIITQGLVDIMLTYLRAHAPPKSLRYVSYVFFSFRLIFIFYSSVQFLIMILFVYFRASGILDSAKWNEFLAKPSLPYILKILTGLIKGHEATQVLQLFIRLKSPKFIQFFGSRKYFNILTKD